MEGYTVILFFFFLLVNFSYFLCEYLTTVYSLQSKKKKKVKCSLFLLIS